MVSIIESGATSKYAGVSGDTKPKEGVPNGSKFYEQCLRFKLKTTAE